MEETMKLVKYKNRITDVWDYPKLSIYNNQIEKDEHYFDFLDEPNSNGDFRLYIHIPFCKSKCKYCSFISFENQEKKLGYLFSLLKEIDYYYKGNKHSIENIDGFKWIPNSNGKVRILEHPVWSDLYMEEL